MYKILLIYSIILYNVTAVAVNPVVHKRDSLINKIDSIFNKEPKESRFNKLTNEINHLNITGDYISNIIAINRLLELYGNVKSDDKDYRNLMTLRISLGQSYNGLGLYSESIKYNTEVMLYAKNKKDTILSIVSAMILGEAYLGLNVKDKGKKYMLDAYEESKKYSNKRFESTALNNLGSALIETEEYDEALKYFDKLEKLENNQKTNGLLVFLNKGECFLRKGKIDLALKYCKLFENKKEQLSNAHVMATLKRQFSEIYLAKGNIKMAEANALALYKIASEHKFNKELVLSYELLSQIASKKKDFIKSEYYQKRYLDLNDSITSVNMRTAIDNVTLLYKIENDSIKIKQLKTSNKLKKLKIRTLLLLLFGLLIIGILVYYQRRVTYIAYKRIVQDNIKAIQSHDEIINLRNKVITNKELTINEIKEFSSKNDGISITPEQCNEIAGQIRHAFDIDRVYLNKDLDLTKLASRFGTNRVYLSYVFNNVIKQSFNEMLNQYRINEAKKLLISENDKYTIEHIAHKSGFSNKATFNRNFKNLTGITPSVFLKISKEEDH